MEEELGYTDLPIYEFRDADDNVIGSILFSPTNDFQIETKDQFHILARNNAGELYNVFSISPDPRYGVSVARVEGSLEVADQVAVGTELYTPSVLTRLLNFYNGFYIEEGSSDLEVAHLGERYLRFGWDAAGDYFQSPPIYNRTTSANTNVAIMQNDHTLRRTTSARKYKDDIQKSTIDPYLLLEIEPKSWIDKTEQTEGNVRRRYYGLIADEVDAVGLGDYVTYDNGEVDALMYDRLWTLLIPIVKDLKKENKQLRKDLENTNKIASDALIRVEKLEEQHK